MTSANKFDVVPLGAADAPQMARLFSEQSPGGKDKYQVFLDRLHWYARNPATKPDVPLGWGVRSHGGVLVGAMLSIPVDFMVAGKRNTFLMSSSFYVDAAHRGCGLPIFFAYRALQRKYVLYASTANEASGLLWQTCNATPIHYSDHELLGPIRWAPLVEEAAFRKLGKFAGTLTSRIRFVANLRPGLRKSAHAVSLTSISSADQVTFHRPNDETIALARDTAFIQWRYFDQPHAAFDTYRFTQEGREDDGYVAVALGRRGYREQIRVLNIADMWGQIEASGLESLISALASQYSSQADMIVLRGFRGLENEAIKLGFLRRAFKYPTGWYIDRTGLVAGKEFSLVPAATDQL